MGETSGLDPVYKDAKIIVKRETKLERCDVCHKSENFNGDTNYCSFCGFISGESLDLKYLKRNSTEDIKKEKWYIEISMKLIANVGILLLLAFASLIICFIAWISKYIFD